ncbi:MAG TPA: DUF4833 domain-containing protein [Bacteroidia bacterium]|nr:DUF4833 domain-containing protein [Bacteroidia bacterium]
MKLPDTLYRIQKRLEVTKILVFILLMVLSSYKLLAQDIKEDGKEFPIPAGNPHQLFYLQRIENINTVIYELNEQNGSLNTEEPIHAFWILYAEQKKHEELSAIEKKYAYGLKMGPSIKEKYKFTLVAYPKISLQLAKDANQQYHVYVTPLKQQMILHRVYIKVKEGGFNIKPNIEYIEFSGIDVVSEKEITERIVP